MNLKRLFLIAIVAFPGMPLCAADVTLSAGYLGGKWIEGGKEGCSSGAARYVIFHGNGTMETGKGEVPNAVGFWSAKDAEITVHLLAAPEESDTTNIFYQGSYNYSYLKAKVPEIRQGAFDIVIGTSVDTEKLTLLKCD